MSMYVMHVLREFCCLFFLQLSQALEAGLSIAANGMVSAKFQRLIDAMHRHILHDWGLICSGTSSSLEIGCVSPMDQ